MDEKCEPFIPSAFSPDGNGQNDAQCVFAANCFTEFKFIIFSRWGELIFETNDMQKCWDGMYDNMIMETGVFYYKFEGKYVSGEKYKKQGTISLVR